MSTPAARSIRAALGVVTPNWLWTWNGACFGYRRGDSLFTYDGIEVGRFSGAEIYGPDGSYLGELRSTEVDGDRLIASSYKKSRTAAAFVPATEPAQKRQLARDAQQLFCGHEDFPLPETMRVMVLKDRKTKRNFTNAKAIR
jgi:hypothetical protein